MTKKKSKDWHACGVSNTNNYHHWISLLDAEIRSTVWKGCQDLITGK